MTIETEEGNEECLKEVETLLDRLSDPTWKFGKRDPFTKEWTQKRVDTLSDAIETFEKKAYPMKTTLHDYLRDGEGKPSAMRLNSLISLVTSLCCAASTIYTNNTEAGLYLTTMFAVGAFAPKAIQKYAEK